MLHLNVNSLRNKIDPLEVLVQELKQPKVLCITEHCLVEEEIDEVSVPGYRPVSWYCRRIQKGGGTVFFVKNNVDVHNVVMPIARVEKDFEYCCVKLNVGKNTVLFVCLYRSPSGCFINFKTKLSDLLQIFYDQCTILLVCGDFNVDFNSSTERATELLDIFNCFNCERIFHEATRITNHSATCIDNVFCNMPTMLKDALLGDAYFSDHQYQMVTIRGGIDSWNSENPATDF